MIVSIAWVTSMRAFSRPFVGISEHLYNQIGCISAESEIVYKSGDVMSSLLVPQLLAVSILWYFHLSCVGTVYLPVVKIRPSNKILNSIKDCK